VKHGLGAIDNTQRDIVSLCEEVANLKEHLCNESSDGQEATALLKHQLEHLHRESSRAVEDLQAQVTSLCVAIRDGNWSGTPTGGQCLDEELRETDNLFEDMEPAENTLPKGRLAVRLTGPSSLPSEKEQLEMLQREVVALKERADFQSATGNQCIAEEMAEAQKLASVLHSVQQQSGQLQEASNALANDLKHVREVVLATADLRQQVQLLNEKGDDHASQVEDLREELFDMRSTLNNLQPRSRKTVCFSPMNSPVNPSIASTVPNGNAAVPEASQQIEGIMKRLDDIQAASSDVLREVGTSIAVLRDEVHHSRDNGCDPVLQSKLMESIADLRLHLTQLLELCMGNRSNTDVAMAVGSSFEVSMPLPAAAEPVAQAAGEDTEFEGEADVQEVHNLFVQEVRNMVAPLARDIASLQQGHACLERAVAASNVLAAGSALVESMQEHF